MGHLNYKLSSRMFPETPRLARRSQSVLSTCLPTKAVFQSGFDRPKQYKGEMRLVPDLIRSIPLVFLYL